MTTPSGHDMRGGRESPDSDSISADNVQQHFADIFAHLRTADETRARAGDVRGLWSTADGTISHLSSRFVTEPNVDFSGGWSLQLQNLWHLYYVAGKHCPEDAMAPLVLQVVETSQRGLLSRTHTSSSGEVEIEQARIIVQIGNHTIQQSLWHDLPLMVPNMVDYWVRDCAHMSRTQRVRISFFLASLTAASTAPWAYGLCSIALIVLRDTLEKERRLVRVGVEPGGEDSENAGRSTDMLTISDLLLCVNAWLVRAGGRIVQLCEMGDGNPGRVLPWSVPDAVSQPGPLAVEAGVQTFPGGFSSQRWFFWLRRLEAIGAEAPSSAGQETGSSSSTAPFVQRVREEKHLARQVAYNMVYAATQSDSSIVRELMRVGRLPL
ncbi:hypothetical protein F5X96DRAFT_340274 [Biscogniauxia mediterranea]|nr:hypothetical protein F5X96DRAFT_340274 [Biscogniauxia mediterranea]